LILLVPLSSKINAKVLPMFLNWPQPWPYVDTVLCQYRATMDACIVTQTGIRQLAKKTWSWIFSWHFELLASLLILHYSSSLSCVNQCVSVDSGVYMCTIVLLITLVHLQKYCYISHWPVFIISKNKSSAYTESECILGRAQDTQLHPV